VGVALGANDGCWGAKACVVAQTDSNMNVVVAAAAAAVVATLLLLIVLLVVGVNMVCCGIFPYIVERKRFKQRGVGGKDK
jgi:hypothetical protein